MGERTDMHSTSTPWPTRWDRHPVLCMGLLIVAVRVSMGCSVINGIDACGHRPGPIADVNRRTEGSQYFTSSRQLVRTAQDTWLAIWVTELEATGGARRSDARIVRLNAKGEPLATTCGKVGEFTLIEAAPNLDAFSLVVTPDLAAPPDNGTHELVTWILDNGAATQVWARTLSRQGCPSEVEPPFLVHEESSVCPSLADRPLDLQSVCMLNARAVALDTSERRGEQFVIVWYQGSPASPSSLRARVVEYVVGPNFLATELDTDGRVVSLLSGSRSPLGFDVAALTNGRWVVVWSEVVLGEQTVWMQVWTDRLEPQTEPTLLARGSAPETYAIKTARIDFGVAVVFVSGGELRAIVTDEAAKPLRRATVRAGAASVDWPSVSALSDGTIFVAWNEQGIAGMTGSGQIRGSILDAELHPAFNNQACDARDFLISNGRGDNDRVNLAADATGGMVVAWTGSYAGGDDRSGAGILSRYYSASSIAP